jgi:hypothetical protein
VSCLRFSAIGAGALVVEGVVGWEFGLSWVIDGRSRLAMRLFISMLFSFTLVNKPQLIDHPSRDLVVFVDSFLKQAFVVAA